MRRWRLRGTTDVRTYVCMHECKIYVAGVGNTCFMYARVSEYERVCMQTLTDRHYTHIKTAYTPSLQVHVQEHSKKVSVHTI